MRIRSEDLTLSSTDMTDATITSNAIWLGHIANYSIQLVFTGSTPNGTFKLQASCDEPNQTNPANTTVVNWTDITDSDQAVTAAGDHLWTVENAGYTFVRVFWTDSSSSAGTITSARFMIKGN